MPITPASSLFPSAAPTLLFLTPKVLELPAAKTAPLLLKTKQQNALKLLGPWSPRLNICKNHLDTH